MVVTPPSCLRLVGDPPAPPATDTAPAPAVDTRTAEAMIWRLRGDGDQGPDVAPLAAVLMAALARIRDLEDPAWMQYRVDLEAWRAKVQRGCR